ncbi:MAG TPA: glycosyltransferase family 39 protein, partial [Thermoanaerobaculia bacterium]
MRLPRFAPALLILLGALRIAATWNIFSATADEGMHVVAGLQVLDDGRYDQHLVNPPLPRVLSAIGPYLAGARFDEDSAIVPQAATIFHATRNYKTILTLARASTVLFFILAVWATYAWTRREFDELTAVVALLLFTTQPAILGHSGLATLDIAGVAGLAVGLLAFSRWLEAPTKRNAAILGVAYGFAIACKLLCIVYVPVACIAIYIVRGLRDRWRPITTTPIVAVTAAFTLWAGYGFSIGRDAWVGVTFPIPAPAFFHG